MFVFFVLVLRKRFTYTRICRHEKSEQLVMLVHTRTFNCIMEEEKNIRRQELLLTNTMEFISFLKVYIFRME